MWTFCPISSIPKPGAFTRRLIRLSLQPDGSHPPTQTYRTFRSGKSWDARFAGRLWRHRKNASVCRLLQVQLRIVAHLSGDEKLIAAFRDDVDIHAATAAEVNGVPLIDVTPQMRRAAKEVNFGILYGMGPQGLSASAGISFTEAQSFIEGVFCRISKSA